MRKIAKESRRQGFHVLCLFTPLFRRFRLSGVSKTIDLDETYRLVSKMFNFMPCGSVLSKSSANRRQIELGSVFFLLPATFGRFADDLPTTFAGRANRRQIELGSVFLELPTTFGGFADDLLTTFAGEGGRRGGGRGRNGGRGRGG